MPIEHEDDLHEIHEPEQPTKLKVIQASSWHGRPRPQRQFLDQRRMIRMGTVTIFTGPGAIGKTLVAMQGAIASATGTSWLGQEIREGPSIIYSAEEPLEEMHIRCDEICEAENMHLDRLDQLHMVDLSNRPDASLVRSFRGKGGETVRPTELFLELEELVTELKPVSVWVDNRGMVVEGNENDRHIASVAMRLFQQLAEKHQCAVVLLSHPSLTGMNQGTGSSGSTGWFNTARSVIYMAKAGQEEEDDGPVDGEDDGKRTLTNNKANYSKMGGKVNVTWQFNRFICTDPPPSKPDDKVSKLSKAERVFMQLLHWHTKNGMAVHASKHSRNYGPKVFDQHIAREGVNMFWFERAFQSLVEQERVKVVEKGPRSKLVSFIVPNEDFNL